MTQRFVVQAKSKLSSLYVFLAKDVWDREHDGSVYYWSNNMGLLSTLKFDNEQQAMKKLARLKARHKVTDIQVIPFQEGVQIVHIGSV